MKRLNSSVIDFHKRMDRYQKMHYILYYEVRKQIIAFNIKTIIK